MALEVLVQRFDYWRLRAEYFMIEEHMNMMVEKHMYTKGAWLVVSRVVRCLEGEKPWESFWSACEEAIFGSSRGFFQGGD